jgi:hypothetical protein
MEFARIAARLLTLFTVRNPVLTTLFTDFVAVAVTFLAPRITVPIG